MSEMLWRAMMGALGLLAGSALNCLIWRLPVMLQRQAVAESRCVACPAPRGDDLPERFNLFFPGSCCPHCRGRVFFYHNIPLLSWMWLRGRCHQCHHPIGWRYPLVELAGGLSSAWVAWLWLPGATALGLALCGWILIALVAIDIRHRLLPDVLTLTLVWLGLLVNLDGALVPLGDAVTGAIAGYFSLWLVYWGFRLATGKEGLGYGDFKLLAAFGAWRGWQHLPQLLLYAALIGLILAVLLRLTGKGERGDPLPFGPCLVLSGWWLLIAPVTEP